MDLCLNDALFHFLLYHYPPLLNEPEAFRALHDFIHGLLVEVLRNERRGLHERTTKVSSN